MKSCYVSIPYGLKTDHRTGRSIDFDRIYFDAIKPAVEEMGLDCFRGDEELLTGIIHKQIFSAVFSSDVMIADLTTANPNVFYELGIRHTVRKGVTILIMDQEGVIPANISYSKVLFYRYNDSTREAEQLKPALKTILENNVKYVAVDSPLYELFPDLTVEVPEGLITESTRRRYKKTTKKGPVKEYLRESSQSQPDKVDPTPSPVAEHPDDVLSQLEVLKALRSKGLFTDLIETAEALPADMQQHPEVRQLLALALDKRKAPGDTEKAISLMRALVSETGGDVDSYGILGAIYRRRYGEANNIADLDAAIEAYRNAYLRQPGDYYSGGNLAFLLLQRNTPETAEELDRELPKIREVVQRKIQDGLTDYWIFATALELSCVARDWATAHQYARNVVSLAPPGWMIASTVSHFGKIQELFSNEEDKKQMATIIAELKNETRFREEMAYA